MTLREQMTLHRKNEPCASCHKLMDPIGFALENFDADAKWRTKQGGDGGVPLDTSGGSVGWHKGQRPDRVAAGSSALFAAICPNDHRKIDDVRPGPGGGIRRYAGHPLHRARRGSR